MKISSEKIDGKILYFQYLCKIVINPMRNIERTDTSRCRRALKAVLKAIWKAADIVLLTAGILSYVIIFAFPDIKVYVYDIAVVLSLVYCSIYLIKWLCRPIWRDWMLVNGHFLIKVVIFVLFTPLAINMCFRLWEGKYGAYSPVNLLVAADTAERLPDSIKEEKPDLFWSIYSHFVDPGNQNMAPSRSGKGWSALIAVSGIILLNGLLVSTLVNWFDKRKGMWLDGEVRYRRIPGNYAIVIGAGEIAASVIRNLLSSRRKGEINYRCESNNRYIILHTCQDARSVRETLSSSLPEEMMKKVIIYRGLRDSLEEIRRLDPYRATEIYILGESASENGGETFHDALNMRCVNIVAEELDRKRSASDKENYERRKVCKVMFEYQTTYSIFQFSDISEVISRNLVFIPFNRYESWARKVMVDCAADTDGGRHIKYTPLDGTGIGEDSDNFVHFIVVGMSKMGVSMGIQALHQSHYPNGRRHMTRISFIDTNADKEMDFFKGRYPVLFELARHRHFDANDPTAGQLCWTDPMERHDCKWGHLSADGRNFIDVEIEFIKGELESNGVRDWLRQAVAEDGARVTIAICLVHTHQAVAAALYMPVEVYKSLNLQEIWVYQREASDIISNLADSKRKNLSYNKLRPFGMLYGEYMADRTLYLKALLVNCAYDISQKNSIYKWPASMSDEKDEGYVMVKQSWKRLFVDKKWSNRFFADSIWVKIRCAMPGKAGFMCAEDILHRLETDRSETVETIQKVLNDNVSIARCEHNRWNVQQLLLGYLPCDRQTFVELQEMNRVINRETTAPDIIKSVRSEFDSRKKKAKESELRMHPNICDYDLLDSVDSDARDYDRILVNAIYKIIDLVDADRKE